jgi:transcriptional regulator
MYIPARFKIQDAEHAETIVRTYPLATLISVVGGEPVISHLPLLLEKSVETKSLIGHLARANPHAKNLAAGEVTAIFHGPGTYITPSWYEANNVPTWNYISVHIRGTVEMIEDEAGVADCVRRLSETMEKTSLRPWEFWIPPDLEGPRLSKAISGFRIHVTDIAAKFKLSQHQPEAERQRVAQALKSERTDEASHRVADWMAQTKSVR